MRVLEHLIAQSGWVKPADLVCVDVTDVARWFYEENDQEVWNIPRDFPTIAPPWPDTWLEARTPRFIKTSGVKIDKRVEATGLRINAMDVAPEDAQRVLEEDRSTHVLAGVFKQRLYTKPEIRATLDAALDRGDKCRWIAFADCYQLARTRGVVWMGTFALYLDALGRALEGVPPNIMSQFPGEVAVHVPSGAFPFFFAISLLHCKNVTVEDAPAAPPPVAKKRAERGVPQVRFKTLVIEPMRKQVRSESAQDGESTSGTKRAMHIARGHFKDFREGDGLFGRHHGMYFWNMQVRGDPSLGTVQKDYRVKPGRQG